MEMDKIDVGGIAIEPLAFKKISYLTELAGYNEIGGFLVVDVINGEIRVQDVLIPQQEVNGAYWETEAVHGSANLVAELSKTKQGRELIPKLKGWWHKHPMKGWSELDKETAKLISSQAGFCVSINSDTGRELVVRIDMERPFKFGIDEVEYRIRLLDSETKKWCDEEFKSKVRTTYQNYNTFDKEDEKKDPLDKWRRPKVEEKQVSFSELFGKKGCLPNIKLKGSPPKRDIKVEDYKPYYYEELSGDFLRVYEECEPWLTSKAMKKKFARRLWEQQNKNGGGYLDEPQTMDKDNGTIYPRRDWETGCYVE